MRRRFQARRLALIAAAAIIAYGIWESSHQSATGTPTRPNVLLVSIDSLRADRVHAMGNPHDTSPTIDALAREGVLFRNAASGSSWTIPAHMTMLTGMMPSEHGVVLPQRRLRESTLTLAEVLRDAGYATAGFVSGPTVRGVYGFSQGFESFDDDTIVAPNRLLSQKGITAPTITKLVTTWLDRWEQDKPQRPFFLFVHMWDVHYDYEPPPPYDSMFDPDYTGSVTSDQFEMNPEINADMPKRDIEHLLALYDGELRFTDDHIGRIVERLRSLGVLDDTIVVVTSDHGDEFFEHGHKGHGRSLFEEVVHVPLVLRYPQRVPAGQVVDRQVRIADVAPTILGLAGVMPPPGFGSRTTLPDMGSRDLTPWLADPARSGELPDLIAQIALRKNLSAVRTNEHKLIVRTRHPEERQLFDLDADPRERSDLIASGREHADEARLFALYDQWRIETAKLDPAYERWNPDAELTERLRALGYVSKRSKRQRQRQRAAPSEMEGEAPPE